MIALTKQCCECREDILLQEFHSSVAHPLGVAPRCKVCAIKVSSEWYKKNKDKKRVYDAKRRIEHRRKYRAASKRWRDNHPLEKRAGTDARRKRVQHATPEWVDMKEIRKVYLEAKIRTQETGVKFHVDHIVPLRGKNVSGLHVPWNLEIIPAPENLRKHNHYSCEHEGHK